LTLELTNDELGILFQLLVNDQLAEMFQRSRVRTVDLVNAEALLEKLRLVLQSQNALEDVKARTDLVH
jgi:hypothetical protein